MALSNQDILELVQKLRERLTAIRASRYRNLAATLDPLVESMERLRAARRRLRLCASRQWFSAAGKVAEDLSYSLRSLAYDAGRLKDITDGAEDRMPSAVEVAAELRQAENEFGQLRYDRKSKFIAVATEAITLGDIYLGEFEIQLLLSGSYASGSCEKHNNWQ